MKIQLIDKNKLMCEEWIEAFKDYSDVVVHHGDFFSLPTDCIVSPANSFGFMDGGLDYVITKKVGIKTQEKLQKLIHEKYYGELLVGQAVLIETEFPNIPYCISAPTMRVSLKIGLTVNVYLAAKAIFRVLMENPHINTVTISGLGTGVGGVFEVICAQQMKRAYEETILDKQKKFNSFKEACDEHVSLLVRVK